jgi:hypothetical protein
MNGAELPSGSVLHVEPASSNSSSGACSSQQSHYGPPANANANVHTNAVGGGSDVDTKSQASHEQPGGEVKAENDALAGADNDEDEDLDDFFDSL